MRRNLEGRIAKLETSHGRPDEILVIWREPDGDVTEAAAGAQFAAGDRAICVEWFGEKPPPAPRWYRHLRLEMVPAEYEYVNRSLMRLNDENRQGGFAPMPHVAHHRLVELTDNELLHIALGGDVKAALERRLQVLESRKDNGSRMVHFIRAIDLADSDRQIAELRSTGKVGPRDGFLSLTGWSDPHVAVA